MISEKTTHRQPEIPFYDSDRHSFALLEELKEVIRYRDLVVELVRRDILARYKRSLLGIIWTMLNPLGMMIVLTLVFSQLFHTLEGYAAYVLSGLIAWNFFAQSTSNSISALAWGGDFFRRIYVPRSVFAISQVGTGLVNLVLSLVPLFAVMLVVGTPIRWTVFFSVIPIFLLSCFALGLGLLISSVAIYFPDIIEMYQIILMAWFYLTPILYPMDAIPVALRPLWLLNPMYHLVNIFRLPLYYGTIPSLPEMLVSAAIAIVTLVFSAWIFARRSNEFAYRA
jgi:ABC-2 type transport system permease protein